MKRELGAALLAAAMILALWPANAAAAETDGIADASELEYFELPVIDPRYPSTDTQNDSGPAGQTADGIVDASELEYFELPVIDPRFPSASAADNAEDNPNAVQFSDIHAVRCIDRLKLPRFAREFYETLERESQPDGFLVDPSKAEDTLTFRLGDTGRTADAYVLPLNYPSETELRRDGFSFEDLGEFISNCMYAAFYAFNWDHPEVFWLNGYMFSNDTNHLRYTILLASVEGNVPQWDVRAEEYQNAARIRDNIASLNRSADAIVREASGRSNYEKITYFNEWLTTNNQYNYYVAYHIEREVSKAVYEAIGALTTVDGQPGGGRTGVDGPVCAGYSKAFQLLCQKAGIPCVPVTGAGHEWNYVQPDPDDNRWYAVDVTWNDPTMSETPTLDEYLKWGGDEGTAYTLVGADTIVYDWKTETFLEQHPVVNQVSGTNFIHARFSTGPELNELAYVDSVTVADLDAPVEGAVPDTRITLTSEPKNSHHPSEAGVGEIFENPKVTWSPALTNGRFAAGTDYTATITCTPRRKGYGLTPADAPKIAAAGAETVAVTEDGAIQVVFRNESPISAGADDFTCRLPANLVYDGRSKTAAVRNSISSTLHDGYFTLTFTDERNNRVADLVKPGTYYVSAQVSPHDRYKATEVRLGSVTVREAPGLHGTVSISIGDSPTQEHNGTAYVINDVMITAYTTPDPGYRLDTIRVIRTDTGREVPVSGSGNVYKFRMPAADVSIQAVFSIA